MADNWEDQADAEEEIVLKPKTGGLNPNAASFSFNPNAVPFSFAPGGMSAPAAPAADPAPPPTSPDPALSPPPQEPAEVPQPAEPKSAPAPAPVPDPATDTEPTEEVDKLSLNETPTGERGAAKVEKEPAGQVPEDVEAAGTKDKECVDRILRELEDPREHMNVVFIGHVDAGKSTTGGQILLLTGNVDERTIQKYEREAKEKNRDSWYMAYIMDTNEEERAKGKTVEVGRAHFVTEKRRYTILDAPGHKNYVPNMIGGASQADIGVLIVSARKGEFETGFEKGGQTREHAQLAKTLGVAKLVIAINKMDDPSISTGGVWSQERYDDVERRITPFLKQCGYNVKRDIQFLPMSGLKGVNVKDRVSQDACPWYTGPSLLEVLDGIDPLPRDPYGPFRLPVMDRHRDMGTIVMGKSEAGIVQVGDKLKMMPNKTVVKVVNIYCDETEVQAARPGENLRLRLTGIEEEEISAGMILCSVPDPTPVVHTFETQLAILELLEHKPILSAGYKAVIHIHCLIEECEVTKLVSVLDTKTKEQKKAKFVKSGNVAFVRITTEKPICLELFEKVAQLGRFTLRDEGKTIAIGKVTKLPEKKHKS